MSARVFTGFAIAATSFSSLNFFERSLEPSPPESFRTTFSPDTRMDHVRAGIPGVDATDLPFARGEPSLAELRLQGLLIRDGRVGDPRFPLTVIQSAMALDDSFITPDHFRDIVHVARDHGLESQTVASAFFFLTNTASQNVADIHLVKVLGVFSARSELLHVARFHPSEGVAKEAVAELSYDHPEVAEWLRSEREALQRAMGADQALFLDRQKRLENALVETVARLEATQVIFTEYGQRLAAAEQRADNLKERQKELKDQLESLEKSLAVHRELVSGLQTSEKEREAELKKVYDALLKTWNSEHITINGTTYKKVRSASGIVKIDSNSRNHNFDLTVHAGEKVLFVITSSGLSEAQKSSIDFRLKRDKKNAKDKDVRKPLRHGDVWVGENYVSNGTRFYVKHESGLNVTGRFYVVTRADPKPELKYKVDTKTQKMIDRAKERIEELSEKQKELSEEATSFTGR